MDIKNIIFKKKAKDQKTLNLIKKTRQELITSKLYPSFFSMPLSLQFELTSRCNLSCKHCYNVSGVNSLKDKMTHELWIKLCNDIVNEGGIFHATFSGGEPLLLGNTLWEMLNILHRDNTVFNLLTNGMLVTNSIIDKLKQYRFFWVQVSVDSADPVQHDKFRGVKGSWAKAVNAAYGLATCGIPVRIASSITRFEIEDIEKIIQMAINLGASYHAIGEIMPSGTAYNNKSLLLTSEDRIFFEKEIFRLKKKYQSQIDISISGSQKTQLEYAALGSVEGAIIRPNGTVRLDCSCPFVIGDITKDNLRNIWEKKHDCWSNPKVKEYIASCDYESGDSSLIKNYHDDDIWI